MARGGDTSADLTLPFLGGNPRKVNRSTGRLQTETDEVSAEAPGIGEILISNFEASLIRRKPGSEISGVPASLIKPTSLPSLSLSIKRVNLVLSESLL